MKIITIMAVLVYGLGHHASVAAPRGADSLGDSTPKGAVYVEGCGYFYPSKLLRGERESWSRNRMVVAHTEKQHKKHAVNFMKNYKNLLSALDQRPPRSERAKTHMVDFTGLPNPDNRGTKMSMINTIYPGDGEFCIVYSSFREAGRGPIEERLILEVFTLIKAKEIK